MKVGSIVECVIHYSEWVSISGKTTKEIKEKTILTVRQIVEEYGSCLIFEEIVNPKNIEGDEYAYCVSHFREIEFPDDLQLQISEALTAPIQIEVPTLEPSFYE